MFCHSSHAIQQPNGNNNIFPTPAQLRYQVESWVPVPYAQYPDWELAILFPGGNLLFRSGLYPVEIPPHNFVYPHGGVPMDIHKGVNVPLGRRYQYKLIEPSKE